MLAAELCLVPRAMIPPTWQALRAWLADFEDRGELQVTDGARRVLDLFFDPPEEAEWRPVLRGVSRLALRHAARRHARDVRHAVRGREAGGDAGDVPGRSARLGRSCRRSTASSPRTRSSCSASAASTPRSIRPRSGSGSASASARGISASGVAWQTAAMTARSTSTDCCSTSTACSSRRGELLPGSIAGRRHASRRRRAVPAHHEHHDAHAARARRDAARGRLRRSTPDEIVTAVTATASHLRVASRRREGVRAQRRRPGRGPRRSRAGRRRRRRRGRARRGVRRLQLRDDEPGVPPAERRRRVRGDASQPLLAHERGAPAGRRRVRRSPRGGVGRHAGRVRQAGARLLRRGARRARGGRPSARRWSATTS